MKTKAKNLLNTVFIETKLSQRFLDENLQKEGFIIEKKVSKYEGYQSIFNQQNVYHLSLKAFAPNEDLIAEQEHLIHLAYED